MDAFHLDDLLGRQKQSTSPYVEFVRVPALSAGVYVLPAGAVDGQQPHSEDEMYYVERGRGMFHCGGEDRPVEAGSLLYVPAHADHRFHSIAEDMVILVFFAPAEYTNKG